MPRRKLPLAQAITVADTAYRSLSSAATREVTPALVRLEPRVSQQLETLSAALLAQVQVPRDDVDANGKPVRVMDTLLPFGAGTDLMRSWPHLLKLSDLPDAQRLANLYESLDPAEARSLPIEAYCYALGISPMRVLEMLTGIIVRQGAQGSTLLAAMWHPRVVEKTIQMALRDEGTADRATLHKATGFVPMPKGASTIVHIQQAAVSAAPAAFVPAPPPESTIRALADTFNEARGLPATPDAPAVIDVAVDEPDVDADDPDDSDDV